MVAFRPNETQVQMLTNALAKGLRFYKTIYNSVSEGVLIQDGKGKILHANPAAEMTLEATLAELTTANYEWTHPEVWFDENEQPFIWKEHAQQTLHQALGQTGMVRTIHQFKQEPCWVSNITELTYTERRESLLSGLVQCVLKEQSLTDTFQYLCDELVHTFGYPVAVVGLKEADGSVRFEACAGISPSVWKTVQARWDDTPEGQGG